MTERSIEGQLTQYIVAELLHHETLDLAPDDELLLDGIIDSIGATRLVSFVEDAWAIDIPAQDVTVENFGSVRQIATYVRSIQDG